MARCGVKYSNRYVMEIQRGNTDHSWLYDISGAGQKQIPSQGEAYICKIALAYGP